MDIRNKLSITRLRINHPLEAKLRGAVLERVTDARFLDILLKEDMPFVGGVLRGTRNNAENIVASTA